MIFTHKVRMSEIDNLLARVISKYIFDKSTDELCLHTHQFLLWNFNVKYIEKSSVQRNLRKRDAKPNNFIVVNAVCKIDVSVSKETSG
jgi:hypothetical protein